jgi:PPOX class probable F420-dependent enzyme
VKLSAAQARSRFAASPVAVLGTADAVGVTHLVPVTFLLSGELLHIAVDDKPKRSQNLRRLRNITANPRVCLLVQHYEADWSRLWWARADGVARILDPAATPGDVLTGLAERYPWYRENPPGGPVIEVTVTQWSGWAFADADTDMDRDMHADAGDDASGAG